MAADDVDELVWRLSGANDNTSRSKHLVFKLGKRFAEKGEHEDLLVPTRAASEVTEYRHLQYKNTSK
jgi:hypothetical protein